MDLLAQTNSGFSGVAVGLYIGFKVQGMARLNVTSFNTWAYPTPTIFNTWAYPGLTSWSSGNGLGSPEAGWDSKDFYGSLYRGRDPLPVSTLPGLARPPASCCGPGVEGLE